MFAVRNSCLLLSFCVALCLLWRCPVAAQESARAKPPETAAVTALPEIPSVIHRAMQSRDFDRAVTQIEAAIAIPAQANRDYLQYLQGIALTELRRYDDAIAAFEQLEKDYPESRWLSRGRFSKAHIYVSRRQYIQAGDIYRLEAERLLSRQRKDELAGIYLEFADRYYEGVPAEDPSEAKQPDYKQALTYYQEAAKLKPTPELLQTLHFRIARCWEELDDHAQSIAAYQRFLSDYRRQDPVAGLSATPTRLAEVQFRLGAVQLAAGQPTAARRSWEDFLSAAKSDQIDPSPEHQEFLAKAEYRLPHTYGFPESATTGDLELGVAAAERFLANYPEHELAAKAELEIAQGLSRHRRHEAALERLRSLIENPLYAQSEQLPIARRMLGETYFVQQEFDDAIDSWNDFLQQHPTDPKWPIVQQSIINAEYAKADVASKHQDYAQARQLWQTFLNKYPLDKRAAAILFQFGTMNYKQAAREHSERVATALNRGDSAQSVAMSDASEKRFLEAIADWRRLAKKYPGSAAASQASYMIGVTLEDRLAKLPEALDAYQQVKGQYETKAKQRIAKLTTPHLRVVTERKFRTDEMPRIKLSTRNLESVSVKTYRIDMADYFRKMHLATGVETLDIALIDPDTQFEHTVSGYQQYRQIDGDVEIPLPAAGVTAVTVASEDLEVTTMVVVSDLDIIVKSSRNELFLFAQNMRTGKPVPGASVLISDGSDVFAEELTNENGVLKKSFAELQNAEDLRVFTVHQGQVASTVNRLNGLDFAVGLSPRGYLYTDRPAYRAGQLVNIKGIVRWVDEDRFTFEPGEKFRLDVYDARGRQIQSKQVALNGYGTINSNLVLPETAPQGNYRVHLHRTSVSADDTTGTLSFESRFQVAEYRLEPIQIEIETDQDVYYRGDRIEGTIAVKYYYGTPLSEETIRYSLGPDGETITAKTDAEGKVKLSLETQRFSESQPLGLQVECPQRGISARRMVYLATRGFAIGVDASRDVYLVGETFDTALQVSDPAGNSVATELKLEVFRQVTQQGQSGEKLVQTHQLESDADRGEARHTMAIDQGGLYLVRATGVDQFGNQVSGQKRIRISGDKDSVRLRILADKHAYQVGETAKIRLHWREEPALALVTFEGAGVLGYRLVDLERNDNLIEVPMTSDLAPNFFLSVAVMRQNEFHTAQSEFQVAQQLRIVLKPDRHRLQPGEDLHVDIEVTDPQGNPVQSEISLALVQTNLLDRFADVSGVIDTFFGAAKRRPAVRQTSSCTFAYRPTTGAVSQFLLAEQQRRTLLELENEALSMAFQDQRIEARSDLALGGLVEGRAPFGGFDGDTNGDGVIDADDVDGNDVIFGTMQGIEYPGQTVDTIVAPNFSVTPIVGDFAVAQRRVMDADSWGALSNSRSTAGRTDARRQGAWATKINRAWLDQLSRQELATSGFRPERRVAGDRLSFGSQAEAKSLDRFQRDVSVYYSQFDAGATVYPVLSKDPRLRRVQQQWFEQLSQQDLTLNALTADGKFLAVNGRDAEELDRLAREDGLRLLPAMTQAETAFWAPEIVTDAAGKARHVITMPGRSTAWRLHAKGIDASSLAGQAGADIITQKGVFGELKLPTALTVGDQAEIPIEIHSSVPDKQSLTVSLKVTMGERTTTHTKQVEAEGAGIKRLSIPVEVVASEHAEFELTIRAGDVPIDQSRRVVEIRPFGYPVYVMASGSSSQSTIALVEMDQQSESFQDPKLEILIGPSVNRALIESVIGGTVIPAVRCGLLPASELERQTSDVLGGVAVVKMIGEARQPDSPEAQALQSRISGAVTGLVSAQRDDGGWGWSGQPAKGQPDVYLSARVMWALSVARQNGFAVANETFDKGKAFLRSGFANSSSGNLERQTILLQAMAESDCADFALANRLYRERNRLSDSGLIHLALALSKMNRKTMAAELLDLVKLSSEPGSANRTTSQRVDNVLPWMQSGVELRALYLLALQEVRPAGQEAANVAKWLMAARVGSRWPVEKANGPTIAALAAWYARTQHVTEKYTLTVFVNDEQVDSFTLDPSLDGSRRLEVPDDVLAAVDPASDVLAKGIRVRFDLQGRGTFSYSAILSGFVPAEDLSATTDDWTVTRRYEPARRMSDGHFVPRGFDVINGSYQSFHNPLTQLPVGQRGEVTLSPRRRNTSGREDYQFDYLVLTEPIPAGCNVLDGSVQGSFERFEISSGQITFFVGPQRNLGDIKYTIVGYVPGEYRTAQPLLRSFYDPSQSALGKINELTILSANESSDDEYRLTPDELYHLGELELGRGDFDASHKYLTELLDNWRLDDDKFKNATQWVFRASLHKQSHGEIVKYFEVIKERFPDIELRFEDILQVAQSYRELGEYERSYLVYRSTVQASFQRESQVAGFLNARGEFIRSVAAMEDLLVDYPAESYIATATYALAQEVYRRAPEAKSDEKLVEQGLTRIDLIDGSIQMLDHFVSNWPSDPASDEASFALATALLDLDQYESAISRCREYAQRYPNSRLLDSFWYMIGYSHFELEQHQQALEMCRKVAEASFPVSATGGTREADNKWEAIYIMGQVYHSLGQAAEAIMQYTEVQQRFADAAEAIEFFSRKQIRLEEVTTIEPDAAKRIDLQYRNIAEVAIKVYRIDLMKFGLMQRNLDRITAINLAGIKPYHQASVQLGDGKDYRDRSQPIELPLEDEGAYLVVCRGENLYASGLVLISPLALNVTEDSASGRVRVTVKDATADRFVDDVHVKVIGSANDDFRSGTTDLRGLFIADNIRGTTTVIAQIDDDQYAFFRGEIAMQGFQGEAELNQQADSMSESAEQAPSPAQAGKEVLRSNLFEMNGDFQQQQKGNFDDLLNNTREGIAPKEAY